MKTEWKEEEVKAFPDGEHEYFERKSGALITQTQFRDTLAKAVCALANSGGGHILLGVQDDGSFDGVPLLWGKTPIREHLEQIIPNLIDYPLTKFRVHDVIPSAVSEIPSGKTIIVIDIDDSQHAPHQARYNKTYYYRSGGRSEPAPHFFLEALRNRTINPILEASLLGVQALYAYSHEDRLFLQIILGFKVTNTGRSIANKWCMHIGCKNESLINTGTFSLNELPKGIKFRYQDMWNNETLLPSLSRTSYAVFGLNIKLQSLKREDIQTSLDELLSTDMQIVYSTVCESARSEENIIDMTFIRHGLSAENILWALPSWNNQNSLYGGYGLYCNNLRLSDTSPNLAYLRCYIQNRSSFNYLTLDVFLVFIDNENRVIHVENLSINRLPTGTSCEKEFSVDKSIFAATKYFHFMFCTEKSHKAQEFFSLLKDIPSNETTNSSISKLSTDDSTGTN